MLLFEILIAVAFSLASSILFVYTQRIPNETKTMEQQALDHFLLDLSLVLKFVIASLNCYLNFMVSKSFRKNMHMFIWQIIPHRFRQNQANHGHQAVQNTVNISFAPGTHTVRLARDHE